MRSLRTGVVLAAVVAVLWLLLPREDRAPVSEERAPAVEPHRPADPAPLPLAKTAPPTETVPGSESPTPSSPAELQAPKATAGPDLPEGTIQGTVVVVDSQGVEHPVEDGSMKLTWWAGEGIQAQVLAGRWSVTPVPSRWGRLRPDDGGRLEVEELKLGGRPAFVDRRLEIPADDFVPIRAWWAGRSILRVVDAESRRDLEEVMVVDGEPHGGLDHPGDSNRRTIRSGARSPIELPAESGLRSFYVRAPGYAWQSVFPNLLVGGEWVVPLRRSAELEVTLQNFDPASDVEVRLHREPREVCAAVGRPSRDGTVRIADLAPGSYDLHAVLAHWIVLARTVSDEKWSGRCTLAIHPGKREATIPVDRTRWLRIAFTDGLAPISPSIHASKARGPGEFCRFTVDRREGTRFGFTRPGRYELTLAPLEGFEPVPPLELVVPPEGVAERTITLIRASR